MHLPRALWALCVRPLRQILKLGQETGAEWMACARLIVRFLKRSVPAGQWSAEELTG